MKIQPIMKFNGIRIELSGMEVEQILQNSRGRTAKRVIEEIQSMAVAVETTDASPDGLPAPVEEKEPEELAKIRVPRGPRPKYPCRYCNRKIADTQLPKHEERCPERPGA